MPSYPLGFQGAPAVAPPAGSSLRIIAESTYTHTAAASSQVVPVPGVLPSDRVNLAINQNDATLFGIQGVAGTDQFTAYCQAAPTASCKVAYSIRR